MKFSIETLFNYSNSSKLQYLLDRGLNEKIIKDFGISYIGRGKKIHDTYFDYRIMIPLINIYGETIGFSGRSIIDIPKHYLDPKDLKAIPKILNTSKYVNTKTYKEFNKKEFFFNEYSLNSKPKSVVIVESPFNAMSLEQNREHFSEAFESVAFLAVMGGAFTTQHFNKLVKYGVKNIIIANDNDEAGVAHTVRALKNILPINKKYGILIEVIFPPKGKDFMDIIKNSDEVVKSICNSMTPLEFFDFYASKLALHDIDKLYNEIKNFLPIDRVLHQKPKSVLGRVHTKEKI